MNWLRPQNITAPNRRCPYEALAEFRSTYGRVGAIIIEAFDGIDPLDAWGHMEMEDFYLGYAEELIHLILVTPAELLEQQDVRADLVEVTLKLHRRYERSHARIIAWEITLAVEALDATPEE